ncbi:MAG: YiiD C-terminal domain-containing protein [Cyanobacteria bacterium P01_E01_bin.34]
MPTDWVARLQSTLHAEIPLAKAMGIELVAHGERQLTLKAPLQPNINHKSTAFGGSFYSITVLTGWGLLFLLLQEEGQVGQIVIAKSDIKYARPVTGDLVSIGQLPGPDVCDRFLTLLRRKGKSRLELTAAIKDSNGQVAVEFYGVYVVLGT